MTTPVVDAHKDRVIATVAVAGVYLSALMEKILVIKLEGKLVNYMVQADPEKYSKYGRMEFGKKYCTLG